MISVIIPAHNEESVIQRCLAALSDGAIPDELEIIVVCNGCSDQTAQVARQSGAHVHVIETSTPSKANALNLGDRAASGFPRVYVDADVVLTVESLRQLQVALQLPGVLAAAPAVQNVFLPDASWSVRAYYGFWMSLPYVQEGMMASGVYALNREGRARFAEFPRIIADDGFVRLHFAHKERIEVRAATSIVRAPSTLWDLIKIKTRSRVGYFELRERCPELFQRESETKHYRHAILNVLAQPRLWPCALPYLWVNLISRWRARQQRRNAVPYVWERDDSSRGTRHPAQQPEAKP